MYGTTNQVDAARHEAGHILVGIKSGGIPRSMQICELDGLWTGECQFEKGKAGADEIARNALAGCLAQAKSCAERNRGSTVTFDYEADVTDFIHIVRDSDRSRENAEPGDCQLAFMDGKCSERFKCEFDGAWFSGMDATMYRRVRGYWPPFDGEDRELICSTMRIIDESDTWLAICRLANALCNQPVAEDGCLSLDGTAINGVIDSVGQARSSEQDGQPE